MQSDHLLNTIAGHIKAKTQSFPYHHHVRLHFPSMDVGIINNNGAFPILHCLACCNVTNTLSKANILNNRLSRVLPAPKRPLCLLLARWVPQARAEVSVQPMLSWRRRRSHPIARSEPLVERTEWYHSTRYLHQLQMASICKRSQVYDL